MCKGTKVTAMYKGKKGPLSKRRLLPHEFKVKAISGTVRFGSFLPLVCRRKAAAAVMCDPTSLTLRHVEVNKAAALQLLELIPDG